MIFKNQPLSFPRDISLYFFALAFFLYALWGSPTPNNPDWVEALIGLCLILAIGITAIAKEFIMAPKESVAHWHMALRIFFLFGVIVGGVNGIVQGHNPTIITRDLIAFVFLCLPLFLYDYLRGSETRQKLFFFLCLIIGLFFAVRVLVPHFLLFRSTTELLYLANSPLVLMSALYLVGQAGYFLYQKLSFKNFTRAVIFLGLASVPIMAMFVDLQRASFAALLLSLVSLMVIGLIKAPLKMMAPSIIILSVSLLFYDYGLGVLSHVGEKTAQVGLNMRLQELEAVWQALSQNPLSILFGQGWGAQFSSPAVGNLNVSYTHSLISYIFFKMGLVGLCLCLLYLYFIFEKWVRLYFSDGVKGNALIWPFIIPIFLYASHKSFDYGVLLTLILVLSSQGKEARA